MAQAAFQLIRGSNMFAEGVNLALSYESATIPKPVENYEAFTPGGANGAVDIATHREALELTFRCKGYQPDVLKLFNTPFGERRKFTWLGAMVDEYAVTNRVKQVMVTAYGRLNVDAGEDKRDALGGVEYSVKSITSYVAQFDDQTIWKFNIALGGWVMEGQSAEIAQAIGLAG